MPQTLAATHRQNREIEAIHMEEGGDLLVFLGRIDKALTRRPMNWPCSVVGRA